MLIKTKGSVVFDKDDVETFIDTRVPRVVRILNGSLDEDPTSTTGVVLNGRIDPSTLRFLRADTSYQRPLSNRGDIFDALKDGTIVPNIDIGVRGQDFKSDGNDFLIYSPVYVIDGWQRVGTALRILELIPHQQIRIFATVHFGTNDLWERHRFTNLNKNVRKISPNLHLKNMRDGNEAVLTLYGLSNSLKDFPLYKKVSWSQNMTVGELMTALNLAHSARALHVHHGPQTGNSVAKVASDLSICARNITLGAFRKNIITLYSLIEECFGIKNIEIRHGATQLKQAFVLQLCKILSTHEDFWDEDGKHLFVAANLRRKLSKFPLKDPHIRNLAGSSGSAKAILYDLLLKHMNSGKRTGHLRARAPKVNGRRP